MTLTRKRLHTLRFSEHPINALPCRLANISGSAMVAFVVKDIVLLAIGAVFGLGATMVSVAVPTYFPNAPSAIWHWLFWGGLALLVLMASDMLILLCFGTKLLGFLQGLMVNGGILIAALGIIWQTQVARLEPNQLAGISFQKYALFWIEVEKGIYQLGALTKFFNPTNQSVLVNDVIFSGENWTLFPRGSFHLVNFIPTPDHARITDDNYIPPNSERVFKKILPIKIFMNVLGGRTPELILRGKWYIILGDEKLATKPDRYTVYEDFVSLLQWSDLVTKKSSINIDELHYKRPPERPPHDASYQNYLIYNPDETAEIDNPYLATTPPAKNKSGIMLFVRGKGSISFFDGWVVLGKTSI